MVDKKELTNKDRNIFHKKSFSYKFTILGFVIFVIFLNFYFISQVIENCYLNADTAYNNFGKLVILNLFAIIFGIKLFLKIYNKLNIDTKFNTYLVFLWPIMLVLLFFFVTCLSYFICPISIA